MRSVNYIVALCILAGASGAKAAEIGLNFAGGSPGYVPGGYQDLPGNTYTAGPPGYAQTYWNNTPDMPAGNGLSDTLYANPAQTDAALIDSAGAVTTASISYAADQYWGAGDPGTTGDGRLYNDFISSNDPTTIAASGIPYASYDVVVELQSIDDDQPLTITLTESDGATTFTRYADVPAATFSSYTLVPEGSTYTEGNYAVFSGITGTSFTIVGDNSYYAGFAGIQIVDTAAVPEPSAACGLMVAASAVLLTRRRKIRAR